MSFDIMSRITRKKFKISQFRYFIILRIQMTLGSIDQFLSGNQVYQFQEGVVLYKMASSMFYLKFNRVSYSQYKKVPSKKYKMRMIGDKCVMKLYSLYI